MPVAGIELSLGGFEDAVQARLEALEADDFVGRLWNGDASLWTMDPQGQAIISDSLGWLGVAEKMVPALGELDAFAEEAVAAGYRHAVYMGMGGSSLCPLVFERSLPVREGGLPLTVLDTTDPETVLDVEAGVPMGETLFFVASKSGTTAEPLAFGDYFYSRVRELKGDDAGAQMAVVTDPGSLLADTAAERGYRRTFLNYPDIGGRFSALSYFGMVPAALMGVDLGELLARAVSMTDSCRGPVRDNPGVVLGAVMGELARHGRDKVTLVVPEEVRTLGLWLEQLIAESTGKQGTGLIPVAGEPLGEPAEYGNDRLFVHTRLAGSGHGGETAGLEALAAAGHPVVTLEMQDVMDLGREFYRWEVATATAGAVIGINAFDQPNVQESKDNTNRLLGVIGETGGLPTADPSVTDGPLSLYVGGSPQSATGALESFLDLAGKGDYMAILAFISEGQDADAEIEQMRLLLRHRYGAATTCGYGPRYLHSTGQLHKGGPGSGLYLLLTAEASRDAEIPGAGYGFRAFRDAQALGDLEALRGHDRRVLHIDLGDDVTLGLRALRAALEALPSAGD